MLEYRVISIGTLAAHPLWDEQVAVRTGHATTTLVQAQGATIVVNPSLPPSIVGARLEERSRVTAADVTHVFLTSFAPDHRRGLGAFERARWLLSEAELEAARPDLDVRLEDARSGDDEDMVEHWRSEIELLGRCQAAPDALARGVDLFPLPGVTPGTCGLLLPLPRSTVLIAGDAVATIEHLEGGKVVPHCHDVKQAQESFREAIEIADVIVLGRDNIAMNPARPLML